MNPKYRNFCDCASNTVFIMKIDSDFIDEKLSSERMQPPTCAHIHIHIPSLPILYKSILKVMKCGYSTKK